MLITEEETGTLLYVQAAYTVLPDQKAYFPHESYEACLARGLGRGWPWHGAGGTISGCRGAATLHLPSPS